MKIAIQQPYFYPYLGYFELIKQVDIFVFFDDVQFIRRGWVNRNRIKDKKLLTIPVVKSCQKSPINEIKISYDSNWHYKHCRSIETSYGKSCLNHPIYNYYKNIKKHNLLNELLKDSIKNVCDFLDIKTKFLSSQEIGFKKEKGKNRILKICDELKATCYYNLPGGICLYNRKEFKEKGIDLNFLDTSNIKNKLSILDVCIGENYTAAEMKYQKMKDNFKIIGWNIHDS